MLPLLTIDTTPPGVASDATVSYSNGVFTIGGDAYTMDGSDPAIRLASLTNAALETDTGSEEVYTYDDESKGYSQAVATTKSFQHLPGGCGRLQRRRLQGSAPD